MNVLSFIGFIIIIIGVLLILIGLRYALSGLKRSETKLGGVVLIGPVPIIFGDKRIASILLIFALAIIFMLLLLYILWMGV